MSADLVPRARGGDAAALEQLLGRHSPAVAARIRADLSREWQSSLSADDVMQHTWLEAFLRIHTLAADDEAGFAAWLSRMAQNNLRDAIRRLEADKRGGNARRVATAGTSGATLTATVFGVDSQTPSRVAAVGETEQALHAALGRLPPDYQLAVQRYDLEGRSIHDVAAELGRSPGAVHLLRVRAHELLRQALSGIFEKSRNSA